MPELKPKIEKGKEEGWVVGSRGQFESLDDIRKAIEKGKPPEKEKKPKKRWEVEKLEGLEKKWEAEGKETEKKLQEELEKARKKIKELGIEKKEAKKEEPKKKEPRKVEIRPEAKKQIIKEVFGGLPKELEDLVGKGRPEDIQKRREIIEKYPNKTKEVLISLAFADTAEADDLVKEYLGTGEKQGYWWAISRGLFGHTSEKAKFIRDWLESDEEVGLPRGGRWFSLLGSLRNSENFFKLKTAINRSRILDKGLDILKLKKYSRWLTPDDSVISEMGNITPESIERRERYIESAPLAVKKSLLGIPPGVSDEIDRMRRQLKVEGIE